LNLSPPAVINNLKLLCVTQLHAKVEMTCLTGQSKVHGCFVLVFYLKVKIFLIIAKVTIQTCISLNGVKNENNLHYFGVFTQVSGFDVCTLGI